MRALLADAGVTEAEIEAETGRHPLRAPEDWWTVVLGSGFRWTMDQMGPEVAAKAREANIRQFRASGATDIETNVVYALASKPR